MTKTLELLGFAPDDRVLIIHADDVGFAHGSNVAAIDGMKGGSLTCCSALVPGPWFIETARLQQASTGAQPLGLSPAAAAPPYTPVVARSLAVAAGTPNTSRHAFPAGRDELYVWETYSSSRSAESGSRDDLAAPPANTLAFEAGLGATVLA